MLKLLNRIRTDWQVWGPVEEINIIHEYAERGRKMTIVYSGNLGMASPRVDKCCKNLITLSTVTAVSTFILFAAQPVISKIIDVLLKNNSEPGEFAFPSYYYRINEQKYYFYITIYSFLCVTVAGFVTVAIDSMFIVYVQHGCGLFSAVG